MRKLRGNCSRETNLGFTEYKPELADPLEVVDVADFLVNHVGDDVASVHFDDDESRQDLSTDLRQWTANQLTQLIQLLHTNAHNYRLNS